MASRLGIIGGGNMGQAIIRGAIGAGVLSPDEIIVAETDENRRASLAELGCTVTADATDAVACDELLIAIKPQSLDELADDIAPLPRSMVVISVMAGKESRTIRESLGENARVVRVMPNTPCRIGAGMAAIALGDGASEGDEALARSIFEAIGRYVIVEESMMHAVTAVSGSGPGYIFLIAEAMEQAALQVGLHNADAHLLVKQTLLGAARMLEESGQTAEELRRAVTSPGGTTAAALEVFFEREFPQIMAEAVIAARDRGRELAEA